MPAHQYNVITIIRPRFFKQAYKNARLTGLTSIRTIDIREIKHVDLHVRVEYTRVKFYVVQSLLHVTTVIHVSLAIFQMYEYCMKYTAMMKNYKISAF